MKLSFATMILSSTVPILGYTPNHPHHSHRSATSSSSSSSTARGYISPSTSQDAVQVDVDKIFTAPQPPSPKQQPIQEDPKVTALALKLNVPDFMVRQEYGVWSMTYDKPVFADESRYATFKRNFLLQVEWNRIHGESFTLNEYADLTEEEYSQLKANAMAAAMETVVVAPTEMETTEDKKVVDDEPPIMMVPPQLIEEDMEMNTMEEEQVEDVEPPMMMTPPPQLIEEDMEVVQEPGDIVAAAADTSTTTTKPTIPVEIVDETTLMEVKYASIESVEERAFEVLKDFGLVEPAPQHYSFSYVNEVPVLDLQPGKNYLDILTLSMPSWEAGSGATAGGMTTMYLDALPSAGSSDDDDDDDNNESSFSVFAKGKNKGTKLGVTTNYLDEICGLIEPFLDCDDWAVRKARAQPKSPQEEAALQAKYAKIQNLGDRAFQILVDLCMVGKCNPQFYA